MYNKGYGGKMRSLLILMAILSIAITSISCLPTKTTPTVSTKDVEQDAAIAEVRRSVQSVDSSKANTGDFNLLKGRVDTMDVKVTAGGGGSTNVYDKTQTYTKVEVDAAIATAISNLKAATDQTWIKTSGGTGGGTTGGTSATGSVVFAINPVSIPQIFSSSTGGNSNPWIMTINNQSTTWQYVKPMISLNVASGQPSSLVSDVSLMASGGNCSLTGTLLMPGNYTFSPSNMATVATPSVIVFPISGCNGSGEWYIGPGQQQAYNIQIQGLKTPNPILWNVTCSISARSM
jgi:hypothetical protein